MQARWLLPHFVLVKHLCWALLLAISADTAGGTAVGSITRTVGGRWSAVIILCSVSLLAMAAHRLHSTKRLALLAPQQIIVSVSAWGALVAVFSQQYGDGVLRPWAFIAGDQLSLILLMAAHTWAILLLCQSDGQ